MSFVGKNIRYLRNSKGLSQEAFAHEIGLNRGNISSYEKGQAEPRIDKLGEMAKFFQIPVLFLIERDLEEEGIMSLNDVLKEGTDVENFELIVRKLDHKSHEIQQVFKGFEEYHKMKMARFHEVTPEINKLAVDFEELLEVSTTLLEQHQSLVRLLISSFKS